MVLRSIALTANRCRIPPHQIRLCPLLLESTDSLQGCLLWKTIE